MIYLSALPACCSLNLARILPRRLKLAGVSRNLLGAGLYAGSGAACLKYGFETWALDEIVSFTAAQNKRSIRVMEKIGMQRDVPMILTTRIWQRATGCAAMCFIAKGGINEIC